MAKLSFFKGAIIGKLGEFVGSRWKGINYIKTFTKPTNAKSPEQLKVRALITKLSKFALIMQSFNYLDDTNNTNIFQFPIYKNTSFLSNVIKVNKQMFVNKVFTPSLLQICEPNCNSRFANPILTFTAGSSDYFTLKTTPISDTQLTGTNFYHNIYYFVYDFVNDKIITSEHGHFSSLNNLLSLLLTCPKNTIKSNCLVFAFIQFTNKDTGKSFISQQYCGTC